MVKRLHTAAEEPQKLAVIDLDGTLVRGNTLHEYLRLGLIEAMRGLRVRDTLAIAGWTGLRALKLVNHRRMKFGALRHIRPDARLRERFAARIQSMLNPEVLSLISEFKEEGCTVLLATAAPDTYIPWIWDGEYLATATDGNPDMTENRGVEKLRRVREYAAQHGCRLYAVVTDHEDDRPLLNAGAPRTLLIR